MIYRPSDAEAEFRRKLSRAYITSSDEAVAADVIELEIEITSDDQVSMERETVQLRKRMADAMA